MRVWSLDYYDDPQRIIKLIDDFIKSNEEFIEEDTHTPSIITVTSKREQNYKKYKEYDQYTSVVQIDAYSHRLSDLVINIIKESHQLQKLYCINV